MPVTEWTAIEGGLSGAALATRSGALSALRQRKDAFELAAVRRAAAAVEAAFDHAPELLRPDMTVRQVVADLDRDIRRHGAEDVRVLVASGPQAGVVQRDAFVLQQLENREDAAAAADHPDVAQRLLDNLSERQHIVAMATRSSLSSEVAPPEPTHGYITDVSTAEWSRPRRCPVSCSTSFCML